jgi:leucyl-tRNA synthetase
MTIDDVITLPVQENGKLRTTIIINKNDTQTQVELIALKDIKIIRFINGRKPKKIIYVPNKILNFIF